MAKRPEQTLGQAINTWVQTIGILIAAAWGFYTFVYKEVWLPKSAPVNISVNLQLKKIGPGNPQGTDQKKKLIAVEMRVSATNPSTRQVYLLPSAWIALGLVDNASNGTLSDTAAARALSAGLGQYVQKHAVAAETPIVAVGSLFKDTTLKPNETTTHTVIIYVPDGTYDRIEVAAMMPTMSKQDRLALEWKLDKTGITPFMYRVGANNERTKMETDSDGNYFDPENSLQMARSVSQVSLWQ